MNAEPFSSLQCMIDHHASRDPQAPALVSTTGTGLSYAELQDQLKAALAHLRRCGVTRRDCVLVALPPGMDLAVALTSIACASVCVPVNTTLTENEVRELIVRLRPKLLVTQKSWESAARKAAEHSGVAVLETDICEGTRRTFPSSNQESAAEDKVDTPDEDSVAFMLSTSGTEDVSKLVPLTHRNVCCSAKNAAATLLLTAGDRLLNVMPLYHGHALISGLLATIHSGSSIVCAPRFTPEEFDEWLCEFESTWYTAVPAIHQSFLEWLNLKQTSARRYSLRVVRSASSPLSSEVFNGIEEKLGVPVIETYGITEGASQVCANPLPPGQRKIGSVGPAAGPELRIVDEHGKSLSAGIEGEIAIRGISVASGYFEDEKANDEAFFDGWFRTGDCGHLDDDGYLYISGRLREFINRGGYKISPAEVESVLVAHASVKNAAAFAMPHPRLGEEVAVAIEVQEGHGFDEEDLRRHAVLHLALAKLPKKFIEVDEIPTNSIGKMSRLAMKKIAAERQLPDRSENPGERGSLTSTERTLLTIWEEALETESISLDEDFFSLGGDSIGLVRMLERVLDVFGVELPVDALLTASTVRLLSRRIDSTDRMGSGNPGSEPG